MIIINCLLAAGWILATISIYNEFKNGINVDINLNELKDLVEKDNRTIEEVHSFNLKVKYPKSIKVFFMFLLISITILSIIRFITNL